MEAWPRFPLGKATGRAVFSFRGRRCAGAARFLLPSFPMSRPVRSPSSSNVLPFPSRPRVAAMNEILELTRSQRLKAASHEAHDRLDKRIMAGHPFASRENYARFVRVQYCFHRDIDALYANPVLASVVPELAQRRRLPDIEQDLADLGITPPAHVPANLQSEDGYASQVTGMGWLYVAEGSNLGAAILFKLAAKLGLDQTLGARHLAGHPDGRARHWREFTAALDRLSLTPAQEQGVVDAAVTAFRRVHGYVDTFFG